MNLADLTHSGSLTLADGSSWAIVAADNYGVELADSLARTMQLGPASRNDKNMVVIKNGGTVVTKKHFLPAAFKMCSSTIHNEPTICQVNATKDNDAFAVQLMQLSLIFCRRAEAQGGVFVHGALAEKDGKGVILAGPGDTGKTTASRRLPFPWKSLSDDCTLVVKDANGKYHAHPWPTWSTFMFGGSGGSWNVQHSIPLKGIFILSQSATDRVEPVGQGQSACMINETAEQAWMSLLNNIEYEQLAAMSLQRFNNICELVKTVPTHLLHFSRNGSFWEEIEQELFSNRKN
jgi:SynChlorMet cassette protein ScmC